MQKTLLTIALIISLALMAWVATESAPRAAEPVLEDSSQAPEAPVAHEAENLEAVVPREDLTAVVGRAPSSKLQGEGEVITIQVVQQGTGETLPGVELLILDRDRYDWKEYGNAKKVARASAKTAGLEMDEEALLRGFSIALITDGKGEAQYRWGGGRALVHAYHAHGMKRVKFSDQENALLRIECPLPGLQVLAQRAGGEPVADLQIVYSERRPSKMRSIGGRFMQQKSDHLANRTDEQGRCIPTWATSIPMLFGPGVDTFFVSTDAVLEDWLEVEVPLDIPRGDTLSLTLPSTGSVWVECVDGAGQVLDGEASVTLSASPARDAGAPRAPFGMRTSIDGRARFPHVEIGKRIRGGVTYFGQGASLGSAAPQEFEGEGPIVQGQEMVLRATVKPPRQLVALILRPDGEPLRDADVLVSYLYPGMGNTRGQAKTDHEGILRMHSSRFGLMQPELPTQIASFEVQASIGENESVSGTAKVSLPAPAGELDLGVIRLGGGIIKIRGVLRDFQGHGIPGATVQLARGQGAVPRGTTSKWSLTEDLFHWRPLDTFEATTDQQGRFILEGSSAETDLGLMVTAKGFAQVHIHRVSPVESNVLVELGATSDVIVNVVHEQGTAPLEVLSYHLQTGEMMPHWFCKSRKTADGLQLTFEGIPEGSWNLIVEHSTYFFELLTIEGFEVTGADGCTDARLDPLDLTHAVRQIQVGATDPHGKLLEDWELQVKGMANFRKFSYSSDVALVVPLPDGLDCWVSAEGFRGLWVKGLKQDGGIEMMLPIQVQFELKRNPVSFSASELELRLEYDPRRDQGFGFSRKLATATGRFDAGGVGTLELSLPGYYRAQFRQVGPDGKYLTPAWVSGERFAIWEQDQGSTLVLSLPSRW
jgi:hypothetical protein